MLKEMVIHISEADDPENTKKVFEPKMKEYFEYCKMVFPEDPYGFVLSKEKMFRFMFYQAFREQKARGGRRVDNANRTS